MKNLAYLIALTLFVPLASMAQEDTDPWLKKKAEIFKPISDEQLQKILSAVPGTAPASPKSERRILVFYRCEGYIHGSIPYANLAIQEMGKNTGAFTADLADTYAAFTTENLAKYDGILLNNTTGMVFPEPAQLNAFLDFVASGKGLIGIHAASDNFGRHPDCRALVGGQFAGHPWNAGGTWAFKVDDPAHILNVAFEGQGFWHTDEIYQYDPASYQGPEVLRLLVSLDMSKNEVMKQINDGPREVPVSWIRKAGDGRVFYTNFGHREDTFQKPAILKHMLAGIQYALGDLEADATPTATAPAQIAALAPEQK